MNAMTLPVVKLAVGVQVWTRSGLNELGEFLRNVAQHPPTARAAVLAVILLLVATGTLATLLNVLILLRGSGKGWVKFKLTKREGDDRVVWLTAEKAQDLGVIKANRIAIVGKGPAGSNDRMVTVRLELRRSSKYFGQDNEDHVQLTQSVYDKLKLNGESSAELVIRTLPWYSVGGVLGRTVLDADKSTALTWRIFLLSLLVSLVVSEAYYERSILDQRPPAASSAR